MAPRAKERKVHAVHWNVLSKFPPNASAANRCVCSCAFVFESLIMHALVEETLRCWDGLVTKEKIYGLLQVVIVQEM